MDDTATLTTKSYDSHADFYANYHAKVDKVLAHLDSFIGHLGGKKVLEVGCGHGRDAAYMHEKGLSVIGTDVSEGLLAKARELHPTVDFKLMDMRHLEFDEDTFDGVWANASVLHIKKSEIESTLQGFARVLRDEGILGLSFQSNPSPLHHIVSEVDKDELIVTTAEFGSDKPRFFAYYKQAEMEALLNFVKFEIVTSTSLLDKKSGIVWVSILAKIRKT